MCLSKRDDQTLATMGRIASYKPSMASQFAHKANFDNNDLKSSVISFWDDKITNEGFKDKKSFCSALHKLVSSEYKSEPYNKLIIHWVEAFNEKCITSQSKS